MPVRSVRDLDGATHLPILLSNVDRQYCGV
jgi:hypothetical protein